MEVKEFDATLGGTEHLPSSVNCLKFAAARSVEIAAMTESILTPKKTKLVFQSLPVHMRRRVMSHNSKRLPRKLRQAHFEQLKKSGLPKQKRPSRKYRRRPANLLDEYNRRQKRVVWLETHIWHAKRFHMTERWGHRLAYAPCDKAFRACYRASSAHCLLQDISYYTPIQVSGPLELIKEMFTKVTNSSCGLGLCAKAYIEGTRQGMVHLYGKNTFPYGYIGRVQFLWASNHDAKILWLFVHPSQTKQVELLLLALTQQETETVDNETVKKKRKLQVNADSVTIKVMPGSFNRFHLTGPNSHAILAKSLVCVKKNELFNKHLWTSLHSPQHLNEKEEYWEKISLLNSPSQLPPNIVVGLVVKDPRLSRPTRRTKAKLENYSERHSEPLIRIPSFLSNSPLWDTKIHNTIKKEKITNHQFIQLVSKTQLVPGEIYEDDPALQSIPVVLIQRPGSQCSGYKKLGYGSGWDIIIPSGYALPFWLTFIMFGARSGGLREIENLSFEMGQYYLPPDSNAGKDNENRIQSDLRERYFKLPPSKRVNYTKIAINSPFICPWDMLLSDWTDQRVKDFFVLRDWRLLEAIQDSIKHMKSLPNVEERQSCLIPVHLKLASKGNLKNHAVICMPEPGDFAAIKTLFEPLHEDPNEKTRKKKRSEHKQLVKKLKRKRMKLKKKNLLVRNPKSNRKSPQEPSEYVKTMRELWLPSDVAIVRNLPSRQVMGFISQGGFSFTEAQSCGIGYIAYNALNMLLCNHFNQVLVRNTASRKYQLANITIANSK
ncbi:unnamed protein product [Arctia plantaginis]|uniref:Uncharacterized protein n=1 Tax=Arctia plantaginis TaxID=874455 RepID=A0A8S1BB61_ARCPL|nr:unnamed protein product [Arctia plantaginis]